MSHQPNGPWLETRYGLCLPCEGSLVKTLSLLQPEASQARTSCSELCAKKRKRGKGEDGLNMRQSEMDGLQLKKRAKVIVLTGAKQILAS